MKKYIVVALSVICLILPTFFIPVSATTVDSVYPYYFITYKSNSFMGYPYEIVYFSEKPVVQLTSDDVSLGRKFYTFKSSNINIFRYDEKGNLVYSEHLTRQTDHSYIVSKTVELDDHSATYQGTFFIKYSNFEIADVPLDPERFEQPLKVVNFEVIKGGNIAKSTDYESPDAYKVTVKNSIDKKLAFYLTLDNSAYVDTTRMVMNVEHVYYFDEASLGTGVNSQFFIGANETRTYTLTPRNMPCQAGLIINAWNAFSVQNSGSTSHTDSSGASHGGTGGTFDQNSLDSASQSISYRCFYSCDFLENDGKLWKTPPFVQIPNTTGDLPIQVDGSEPDNFGIGDITSIGDFFKKMTGVFTGLSSSLSNVTIMFRSFFSFLPAWFWALIMLSMGLIVLLRVFGR